MASRKGSGRAHPADERARKKGNALRGAPPSSPQTNPEHALTGEVLTKHRPEQARTVEITTIEIMSSHSFRRGFENVRAGVAFDWRIGSGDGFSDWSYERGRLFAHIAPLIMPLWIGRRLNPKAVALFDAALERRLVI
jgi:hypothetical protein